jgi:hypothetical protein
MYLTVGVLSLCLAMLLYGVVLIGSRNPNHPKWSKDGLVANIYVPAIILFSVFGLGCAIQFILTLSSATKPLLHIVSAVAIGVAGVAAFKALKVDQKISAFETLRKAEPVASILPHSDGGDDPGPSVHPATPGQRAA